MASSLQKKLAPDYAGTLENRIYGRFLKVAPFFLDFNAKQKIVVCTNVVLVLMGPNHHVLTLPYAKKPKHVVMLQVLSPLRRILKFRVYGSSLFVRSPVFPPSLSMDSYRMHYCYSKGYLTTITSNLSSLGYLSETRSLGISMG